jgi:hypothetical protein
MKFCLHRILVYSQNHPSICQSSLKSIIGPRASSALEPLPKQPLTVIKLKMLMKLNIYIYLLYWYFQKNQRLNINKGNAKRGVSPRLKIRPCDLDLWPWKSIGFQILLRSKYVPSLVKIHWRILILECSQGCYAVKIWPGDIDLWSMTLKINRVPDSPKD